MRGRLLRPAAFFLLLSACAAPPPPAPPAPPAPEVYSFPPPTGPAELAPGGGENRGDLPAPPADALALQKEILARAPESDAEKLRLALLLAAASRWEEADRILGSLKARSLKLVPYLELFLKRRLGDRKEAARVLSELEAQDPGGLVIERAEVCSKVRRFRDFVPAGGERLRPGGFVLLYVEPRNFTLREKDGRHHLHLRYEWKLLDERSAERPVEAWDRAPASDREDRNSYSGPIREFYQSFRLPLPADLPAGSYRIRVTVTDVLGQASDRVTLPIEVGAEGDR